MEQHIHVRWLAPYFMPAGGIPTRGPDPSDAPDMDLEAGPPPPVESGFRAEPQPLGVEPPPPMELADGLSHIHVTRIGARGIIRTSRRVRPQPLALEQLYQSHAEPLLFSRSRWNQPP